MMYNNLEILLGKQFLREHQNHEYNKWKLKSEDSKEKMLLNNLESYLKRIRPSLKTKRIQDGLQNNFVDTYYELEVGCYFLNHGFEIDFEKTLRLNNNDYRTPDIFVKNENVIIEVKTLHQSDKVKNGIESGEVFFSNPSQKVKDKILDELDKYSGSGIKHPLVVILCSDYLINPPIISVDDLDTVLVYRSDRLFIPRRSTPVLTSDIKYDGLYFIDKGQTANTLSGVGLWRKKLVKFYENPNVKRQNKIPRGKLLDFLYCF